MSAVPQTHDLTLEPEDNARLANLCGPLEQHLRHMERRLGIEINNRGPSFRLIGDGAAVGLGERLLLDLYAQAAEEQLTPEHIHLALREFAGISDHAFSEKFPLSIPEDERLMGLWG